MLTMDRRNFPGMPDPNWTYGGIRFYVAKDEPPLHPLCNEYPSIA